MGGRNHSIVAGRQAGFSEHIKSHLITSVWVRLKVTFKVRDIACTLLRNTMGLLLMESQKEQESGFPSLHKLQERF